MKSFNDNNDNNQNNSSSEFDNQYGGLYGNENYEYSKVESMDNPQNNYNNSGYENESYNSNFNPNSENSGKTQDSQNLIQNNTPSQTKKPKTNPFFVFLRFIFTIIVIIFLILASIAIFILINPRAEFSRYLIENTSLNQFIEVPGDNQDDSNSDTQSKIINRTLGLEEEDQKAFSFAEPEGSMTVSQVVEKVLPSVISVNLQTNSVDSTIVSSGSGFLVNDKGLVVTNRHVIDLICSRAGSSLQIIGTDYKQNDYKLSLKSVDPVYDLAILEMENTPENPEFVEFADSQTIILGTEVLAVGNALGEFQNTVTKGIVSGLNRNVTVADSEKNASCTDRNLLAEGLIQTDAAINPGNSGGPLFDPTGRLIGINSLGANAENIGLAIPSNIILSALNSYNSDGIIKRPFLGVFSRPITPAFKTRNQWIPSSNGEILISQGGVAVSSDSAASKAGLKEGDIILEINGNQIQVSSQNPAPLRSELLKFAAGEKVILKILPAISSQNGQFNYGEEKEIEVELGEISVDLK